MINVTEVQADSRTVKAQQSTKCVFVLQRARANQIIPCTVSQLMSASQADEAFKVGDVEVAQVSWSKVCLSNV